MARRDVIEHEYQPDLTGPADPYRRLGVTRDVTVAEIKRAWRKVAQKHHPDHGGDADIFAELKMCYETLIDPERRAAYDRTGDLKDKAPDNTQADAFSCMVTALERVIGGLMQSRTEPRHVDMIRSIREMIDTMEREFLKEMDQITESLPEWEAVAKRFKVKKGENVFERHITMKVGQFKQRREQLERHLKAARLARKLMSDYSFDWERPDAYQQKVELALGFKVVFAG